MKAFALLSALFFSFSAHATTPIFHQTEVLPKVEINGQETRHTAVVNIDFHSNSIKAEIYNDICGSLTARPGDIICMAMPMLVTTFEAPLTERSDSCGSYIYKAFSDQSIVDGLRVSIVATDHSQRLCKDLVNSAFEVEASVFNPWTNTTTEYYLSK